VSEHWRTLKALTPARENHSSASYLILSSSTTGLPRKESLLRLCRLSDASIMKRNIPWSVLQMERPLWFLSFGTDLMAWMTVGFSTAVFPTLLIFVDCTSYNSESTDWHRHTAYASFPGKPGLACLPLIFLVDLFQTGVPLGTLQNFSCLHWHHPPCLP